MIYSVSAAGSVRCEDQGKKIWYETTEKIFTAILKRKQRNEINESRRIPIVLKSHD